jgi:uncharacterized protein (DUF3820 family)
MMKLPSGKYKGVEISEAPQKYLWWLLTHVDLSSELTEAIMQQLFPPPRAEDMNDKQSMNQ